MAIQLEEVQEMHQNALKAVKRIKEECAARREKLKKSMLSTPEGRQRIVELANENPETRQMLLNVLDAYRAEEEAITQASAGSHARSVSHSKRPRRLI